MKIIRLSVCVLLLIVASIVCAQSLDRVNELIGQGKYREAAVLLRPLADGGNAEAQYLAATLFLEAKGVARNPQQAFKYAKMAADNTKDRCEEGLLLTSWMCYEGIGTKKDADMALTYARQLTEGSQYSAAKKLLGEKSSFDEEPFPAKNEQLAYLFLELISHTQDTNSYVSKLEALSKLSRMCYEGVGTKKDTAQAIRYATFMCSEVKNYFYLDKEYQKLAQYYKERSDTMYFRVLAANKGIEGDIASQRSEGIEMKKELIQCYLEGIGCARNPSAALRLIDIQKSIRTEYLDASSPKMDVYVNAVSSGSNGESLANFCDKNNDGEFLEALLKKYSNEQDGNKLQNIFQEWLSQAEKGSPSAMWMVSVFYEKGMGVSADIAQSRQWAQKAADIRNVGIWWARNEYLKNKPLAVGEVIDGKVVVESKVVNSSYTGRRGKATQRNYVYTTFFDVAIKEMTAKEINEGFKNRELNTWQMPEYQLDAHFKIYAEAKKRMGQPIPAGRYWAKKSWKDKDAWLLEVNADGVITGKTSIKDLKKNEKEKPYYFLVESFKSTDR